MGMGVPAPGFMERVQEEVNVWSVPGPPPPSLLAHRAESRAVCLDREAAAGAQRLKKGLSGKRTQNFKLGWSTHDLFPLGFMKGRSDSVSKG